MYCSYTVAISYRQLSPEGMKLFAYISPQFCCYSKSVYIQTNSWMNGGLISTKCLYRGSRWEVWGASKWLARVLSIITCIAEQQLTSYQFNNPTYHKEQLQLWLNSLSGFVAIYSQLPGCPGKMKPFNDHPSTCAQLQRFRNKPRQKLPWETFQY